MPDLRPLYICGPTASGKSALAIRLARELNGEIVNADAFQLYQGIPILSAAPTDEEKTQAPHHLYAVLDPTETCNAGRYTELAQPVIAEIQSRGKIPIVTGGSGLYLKFLTHGPAPLPKGDPALRATHDALSLDELAAQLRQLDPVEAARTDLKNRRYLSRALEICQLSGQPASLLRDQWLAATAAATANLRGILIDLPRETLHTRIAKRTRALFQAGIIDEVAALGPLSETCEKAIGIREIRSLLAGQIDLPTCIDLITFATRQYAKRQLTWFRREPWLTPTLKEEGPYCPSSSP
jgi:tRNA dimethylallyltransferase